MNHEELASGHIDDFIVDIEDLPNNLESCFPIPMQLGSTARLNMGVNRYTF